MRARRGSVFLIAILGIAGVAFAQNSTTQQPAPPPRDDAVPISNLPGSASQVSAASSASGASGCDTACVRASADLAGQICAPRIEAEAPTDFEWVSRPFAKIFQQADPPDGTTTVIRYRGDSIRFLSPQREWVRITYECGFDAAKRSVDYVRVRLGRLDKSSLPPEVVQARPQAVPTRDVQTSVATTAAVPNKVRPSEPSEIEISQVNPRVRQARP